MAPARGPRWLCRWVGWGWVLSVLCPSALSPEPGAALDSGAGLPAELLYAAGLVWHTLPRLRARGHADGKVAAGV